MSQAPLYNTDNARYEAYQFSDPFATASFVCCNKKLGKVCRPNCDHYPKVTSKEDVSFLFDANQAVSLGFESCEHCDPINPNTQLDLPLIKITIDAINNSIGFTDDANDLKRRAFSVPSINTNNGHYDRQLTRNESEHIKLVELACRHIAAAAALSISKQNEESAQGGKKKRRGGVLGFKELASKSKLSPWHFHRVFKSVTGLTPKSYGDQCWKYIKDHDRPPTKRQRSHFKSLSEVQNNFQAPKKMGRVDHSPVAPTAPAPMINVSPTAPAPMQTASLHKPPMTQTQTDPTSINAQLAFNDDLFDLNKNSLDINMAPLRHHSLDLGTLSLNIGDLDRSNSLSPSSNYIPIGTSTRFQQPQQQQQSHPQVHQQQQVPNLQAPQYPQFHMNSFSSGSSGSTGANSLQVPTTTLSESVSPATDISSFNPNPIDNSLWPSLEGAQPADSDISKMLTPPSSVSEVDHNQIQQQTQPSSKIQENLEFYDVLNKSPLDDDDFLNLEAATVDYSMLNDGSNDVGAGLFLGTDGNETFNDITLRAQNNLMI